MRLARLFPIVLCLFSASVLMGANPGWWTDSGTGIIDGNASHAVSENYAPANLGQLKNAATMAKAHLDTRLPGGAGGEINALVAGFANNPAENYAPINLGQLKAVAKPFYDRLLQMSYPTQANLVAQGFTGAGIYPWDPTAPVETNYGPANLGQLKMVFSFDLAGFPIVDTDGDGLSNAYEAQVGSNPNDYFSQGARTVVPRIFVFGGGGEVVPSGQYSAAPIIYKVIDAATGVALPNAPVSIVVSNGPGTVAPTKGGATSGTIAVRSDLQGLAKVYFKAP